MPVKRKPKPKGSGRMRILPINKPKRPRRPKVGGGRYSILPVKQFV